MNLTSIQKEKVIRQYIQWSDNLFDDLEWVTSIPPEVFVQKIIDLVEEEVNENYYLRSMRWVYNHID